MKLLSEHPGAGTSMAASEKLSSSLKEILKKYKTTHVIETGTFRGLGSTTFVAESFPNDAPPELFVTIEVNWMSWRNAKFNLQRFPFVTSLLGRTVAIDKARQFLENDDVLRKHNEYPDIFIDNTQDPLKFYLNELEGALGRAPMNPIHFIPWFFHQNFSKVNEGLLEIYLQKFKTKNPLIILDSAGGIGYLEFLILQEIMQDYSYLLLLDDIHHIKHFRSHLDIKNNDRFSIIDSDVEEGWLLARYEC